MTPAEVKALLSMASAVDGRIVTDLAVAAWTDVAGIADADAEDARQALAMHRAENTPDKWFSPYDCLVNVRRIKDERDREVRRMMEQGTTSITAGMPPWMDEATEAARAATEECLARGLGRSHPTTKRSALAAANEVQDAWEAEHGAWNVVGRTVVEEEPLW